MKSRGTKETQGINGDAANLQRFLDAVPLVVTDAPCPFAVHRGQDWCLQAGGPVVCGVCHPAARGLLIVGVT